MPSLIDIESLLEPVSKTEPAGPDLEYAPDLIDLERAVADAVAEWPPIAREWRQIARAAELLSQRTKDLRVAVILTRALVATEGWAGLRDGLAFIRGLLDQFWVSLHPRLDCDDENDPIWRLNILTELGNPNGLIRDLYAAPLVGGDRDRAASLADIDKALGAGEEGTFELSASIEIDATFRAADEQEVREMFLVLQEATGHLVAVEALLSARTGRSTDEMHARLVDALECALRQLEGGLKRGDLVFNLVEAPSDLKVDLRFESMEDFEPEKIAERMPALKKLLDARRALKELVEKRNGSVGAPAAETKGPFDGLEGAALEMMPGGTLQNDEDTVAPPVPSSVSIPEDWDRTAESEPPREEPARIVDEDVQFTVYRPRSVVAERWCTLLAFAHLAEPREDTSEDEPDPVEEVHRQAMSVLGEESGEYQALTDDSTEAIPEYGQLTFVPYVPGIEFNPGSRSFRWTEAVHRESFRMRASATLTGKRARGRLSIFLGSILIGEVSLSFRVVAAGQSSHEREPVEPSRARPYRKIFPSYAHADAVIVEQFERFVESLGDAYLRDVATLRVGEVWDERLGELIAEADVFQLFWSTRSMASRFVRSEWERALALERHHFIRPVYWQYPLPERLEDGLPPPALRRLHFQRIAWALPVESTESKEEVATGAVPARPPELQIQREELGRLEDERIERLEEDIRPEEERIRREHEEAEAERKRKANRWESIHQKLGRVRSPRVHITYKVETEGAVERVELPFVMGVLADFSGKPKDPLLPVADRQFLEIDRDNFNELMKSFKPRMAFIVPNALTDEDDLRVDLTFENMEDFSPSVVARKVLVLHESLASGEKLSTQINLILHHDDFQKLEGTWRGLYYLVSNTETSQLLKIRMLNISKVDLAATLKRYKGVVWDQSPVFKKLNEEYGQFRGKPYGCLVGDYHFDHSPSDVELLGEMGKICSAIHAPFITGASPTTMHMDSWQELNIPGDLTEVFQAPEYTGWRSLRDSEDSLYIGLTMPRFLSRLPYGARTNPVEEFDFEEDTEGADFSKYTWANSAYVMATNINRSFLMYGWFSRISGVESGGAAEGLPVHNFPTNDGVDAKCSTEIAISDRRGFELEKSGFMPLVHQKNSEIAIFIGAQSLHKAVEYDDYEVTVSAHLMARLPYLLTCCRFAQYVKYMVLYRISSFVGLADMEQWLNNWIRDYVTLQNDPSEETSTRCPLAAAEVILEEAEDNPAYINAKLYLQPHYQLEGQEVRLQMVFKLPHPRG